jgi:hypothetical protein
MKLSQGKRRRVRDHAYQSYLKDRPLATLKIDDLHVDPSRFQYKIETRSSSGDTGSLGHISAWNFSSEGILDVWFDPGDLKTYVVNGHNRIMLARRLGVMKLPCKYLISKTWKQARRDGAIANISQGCGSVLDAAKFFRDGKLSRYEIKAYGISLASNLVKHGLAIAGLCDRLFDLALSGILSESHGVILGSSELTEDEQIALYKAISEREKSGSDVSESLLRELVAASKYAARETVTELTLFGSEQFETLLLFETATVQEYVRSHLSRSRRALVSAIRSRDTLESAGNVIAVESSGSIANGLSDVLERFDREKSVSGEIASAIAIAARSVRSGMPVSQASEPIIDMLQ